MLPMPFAGHASFKSCCGKVICSGCIYVMKMSEGKDLCAFCRTPPPFSIEEEMERTKNLMGKGNVDAFNQLASYGGGRVPNMHVTPTT